MSRSGITSPLQRRRVVQLSRQRYAQLDRYQTSAVESPRLRTCTDLAVAKHIIAPDPSSKEFGFFPEDAGKNAALCIARIFGGFFLAVSCEMKTFALALHLAYIALLDCSARWLGGDIIG